MPQKTKNTIKSERPKQCKCHKMWGFIVLGVGLCGEADGRRQLAVRRDKDGDMFASTQEEEQEGQGQHGQGEEEKEEKEGRILLPQNY